MLSQMHLHKEANEFAHDGKCVYTLRQMGLHGIANTLWRQMSLHVVRNPNFICMILAYRITFGAGKISLLQCQKCGFWRSHGVRAIPKANSIS